jgi:hypothetical protein
MPVSALPDFKFSPRGIFDFLSPPRHAGAYKPETGFFKNPVYALVFKGRNRVFQKPDLRIRPREG